MQRNVRTSAPNGNLSPKSNRIHGHVHRNGTKPPAGVRVVGTPPKGAMAKLRAARIASINVPGRAGASFLTEALETERRIAEAVEFRVRP